MTTDNSTMAPATRSSLTRLACVAVLTGVVAGLGGMGLALLLHFIQHVGFGYDMYQWHGAKSFLEGVSATTPARRVAALGLCGLVAGLGWRIVYGFCKPLVSIREAVSGSYATYTWLSRRGASRP